jgi:hydroxymethylbilane synthase
MTLVLGTRGSALARAQAERVAVRLGDDVELRIVRTHGDDSPRPIRELGDGSFVTALEDALRRSEIDVAVHSLKDLPTDDRAGLVVAAIPEREDPRDVLVTRERGGLATLPPRARVGTGSARRAAQLRVVRPDLEFADIRGNVDTRLAKVSRGEYDATVLALAGLRRLGVAVADAEVLSLGEMLPAPGQGALAVQCRADDSRTRALAERIDDRDLHRATDAERELLRLLGGSCDLALGAYAHAADGEIALEAILVDGGAHRVRLRGVDPIAIARQAARELEASRV